MARPKGALYLMTIALLLLVFYLGASADHEEIISFEISFGDHSQPLSLWEGEDGCFYVFLPSCADMEQVQIRLHTGTPVCINGVRLEEGMSCRSFSEDGSYPFSYFVWGRPVEGEIRFLRSANLAAMYIDTLSGSMDYIHAAKGNRESGMLSLYLPDGTVSCSVAIASIQGRGNYTWTEFEKKPYSLELTEAANLLKLGSAKKWILLANADDPSHMRNKVIFDFADRAGLRFSPDADWVDLYLNGEYAGLYLLSERNEIHPQRVNIGEENGFLVSLEKSDRLTAQKYPHFSTTAKQYLRVHNPKNLQEAELQKLETVWQSAENAILAENNTDPVAGKHWMEQIDLDSWVRKYLIEELFAGADACFISQFFYCDGNDSEKKIYAGPVWDYDHAMGLESIWQLRAPNTLYANRYAVKDGFDAPWFHALYHKDIFYDRMVEVYQQEYLPLIRDFLFGHIATCSQRIAQSHRMDQIRWDVKGTDIRDQTAYLQTFMKKRTDFLNSIWIEKRPYYTVKADNAKGSFYGYYAVFPGESLIDLPELPDTDDWEFQGWYEKETGEPFCPEEPIRENLVIYAKWKTKPALWLNRFGKLIPLCLLLVQMPILLRIACKRSNLEKHRQNR